MKKKMIITFSIIILGITACFFITQERPNFRPGTIESLVIISPPYKKTVTDEADIREFAGLFNSLELKGKISIGSPSGWSKRVMIETDKRSYDIIFAGERVEINGKKYTVDSSAEDQLNQYYDRLAYDELKFN